MMNTRGMFSSSNIRPGPTASLFRSFSRPYSLVNFVPLPLARTGTTSFGLNLSSQKWPIHAPFLEITATAMQP